MGRRKKLYILLFYFRRISPFSRRKAEVWPVQCFVRQHFALYFTDVFISDLGLETIVRREAKLIEKFSPRNVFFDEMFAVEFRLDSSNFPFSNVSTNFDRTLFLFSSMTIFDLRTLTRSLKH